MKKWILLLVTVIALQQANAQGGDNAEPAYKRFPTLPPMTLLQADSTNLTKENLAHQPTLIMYFSPTCDHCKHQWEDMLQHMEQLKKIQIVMVTYQPFEEMLEFYKSEKIDTYPNIKMGRDTKFTLPPFFQIQSLPYQALYDKKGKLINTFAGNVKVETMLKEFEKKK